MLKKSKTLLILFIIPVLLLSVTACNRKNSLVTPNLPIEDSLVSELSSAAYINDRFSSIGSAAIVFNPDPNLVPSLRASLYIDPRGENLALRCGANLSPSPNFSYGWGPNWWLVPYPPFGFNHPNFVDGDPSTGAWFTTVGNYPLIMEAFLWSYPRIPFPIDRFYAVIQGVQSYQLLYCLPIDNGWEWFIATSGTPIPTQSGAIIDVTLDPPIMAIGMGVSLMPSGGPIGLMEFGFYGPSPASLKITSPANEAQFTEGENILFTSSSSTSISNYQWFCDGSPLGLTPNSANTSAADLSLGNHTIRLTAVNPADSSVLEDSITICVYDIAEIKIKNLNTQDFLSYTEASYRAAKTQFQAIGYREDGSEIGPVSVRWDLEGGEVDAQDQLKMGILSQLGQLNTKIGNLDNSLAVVASSSTVTFNSFLPGNITINASKGNLTDSVNVRIKQPHFKVNVYPVGDVDTSIFNTWKDTALQIWEKENIIKVDSIDLMPAIANVSYPDYPLTPPLSETENILFERFGYLSYSNPLVYDCLLGNHSGFFYVPKQSGLLLEKGEIAPLNVFMVQEPWSYYVSDSLANPPEKRWRQPVIYSISNRDHFVTSENSSVFIKAPTYPYFASHERYLAAGIGSNFGLPQYADWLNNFMDFSDNGALDVTPLQYIAALNYNNDNPQNSVKIWEE